MPAGPVPAAELKMRPGVGEPGHRPLQKLRFPVVADQFDNSALGVLDDAVVEILVHPGPALFQMVESDDRKFFR